MKRLGGHGWILGALLLLAAAVLPRMAKAGDEAKTLTGEPIDIVCYMGGQSGTAHAGCAATCVSKGKPAGLAVKDGDKTQVYLAIGSGANAPAEAFKNLWGKQVRVTGKVMEKDGIRVIDIGKVEAAG